MSLEHQRTPWRTWDWSHLVESRAMKRQSVLVASANLLENLELSQLYGPINSVFKPEYGDFLKSILKWGNFYSTPPGEGIRLVQKKLQFFALLKFSFNIGIHSLKKYMVILYIILMHISHFFANELLLAVYFIFILDYRTDVRQKANLSDCLIWVQNGL